MRSSSFPRPTAGFGFAGNENCRESSAVLAPKKEGPPLGMGAPEGAFPLLASFSHQRVGSSITCFPLRGRWERSAKSDKQAPSPSLVSPYISSFETRPRCLLMQGFRQCGAPRAST